MAGIEHVLAVDQALAQTARLEGVRYAVVPKQWMLEWLAFDKQTLFTPRFDEVALSLCMNQGLSYGPDHWPIHDGDFYLCFLPYGHEGQCGYEQLLERRPGVWPVAAGFECIPTLGQVAAR